MPNPTQDQLAALLCGMETAEASDLHLVPEHSPMFRIHGELSTAAESPLTADQVHAMITGIAPAEVRDGLGKQTDFDFAIQIADGSATRRFRVNVFSSRGKWGACFRAIPDQIPTLPELGLGWVRHSGSFSQGITRGSDPFRAATVRERSVFASHCTFPCAAIPT